MSKVHFKSYYFNNQDNEKVLERVDQLQLEYAKRAAVSVVVLLLLLLLLRLMKYNYLWNSASEQLDGWCQRRFGGHFHCSQC